MRRAYATHFPRSNTRPPSPQLFRALHPPLLAAPVRVVLAVAALLGAFAVGIHTRPALLGFGAGTFGTIVLLLSDRRGILRGQPEVLAMPADAGYEPIARTAWLSLLPSTVGTTLLAGASLAFSRALTVLLGGILLGMAIAGLLNVAQVAAWEHRHGGRLFVDRHSGHRFVAG